MPQYQSEIAALLSASILSSLVAFYFWRNSGDGKIQLPTHTAESDSDPFDVTRPVDLVDGFPLDEEKFWARTRGRKLIICLILAAIVIFNTIGFGWSVVDGDAASVTSYSAFVLFSLYVFALAARAVRQNSTDFHGESITHLFCLISAAALSFTVSTILPAKPLAVITESDPEPNSALSIMWTCTTVLFIVADLIICTTPFGPAMHYPSEAIYSEKIENVCGVVGASIWDQLMFSYTTKVVMLGNIAESLEIGDLPIVPASVRSTNSYVHMKRAMQTITLKIGSWTPTPGTGWNLGYRLMRINSQALILQFWLASVSAVLYYAPPFFLEKLILYLESDPERKDKSWGLFYVVCLFVSALTVYILGGQLWSLSTNVIQARLKTQLNSILFAKTLVRKDVASNAKPKDKGSDAEGDNKADDEDEDFSTKVQIMTLMTTDVDRLSEFAFHIFSLVDSPIEIVIGSIFLYKLLGVSSFIGLAVTFLFLPMNHFAGKIVVSAQDNLMKTRDERIALMNEAIILGAIRMLKFMAWERSFEARVLQVREKELKYQRLTYNIEIVFNAVWQTTPVLVTLVAFWHFAVIRGQQLTPSIAFTSIIVFAELKFALNALPETFINMLQSFVSMRRIEKYLLGREVAPVAPIRHQSQTIGFQSCTVTWPQDRLQSSNTSSAASTPRHKFVLTDLSFKFPLGELSLVCGKLGSGKTLLLLALLGEADILAGQVICPRSPPDALASFATVGADEEWVIPGICAYVPQAAWLRNASIKDNILFSLPYDADRYQRTLEACALVTDLEILEDGDESEIGERGVNLSGGQKGKTTSTALNALLTMDQKARVSLARAVYSRASVLFLDDVLSAVDAHTAHHLYHECLKGDLMANRTVILVSHHVQLCAPGANYVLALDNGRVSYSGSSAGFQSSGVIRSLVQSTTDNKEDIEVEEQLDVVAQEDSSPSSETSTLAPPVAVKVDKKPVRKLVEEETRAIGRIGKDVWKTYISAAGTKWYWILFGLAFGLAAVNPVLENGWLKTWSHAVLEEDGSRGPTYYVTVYALVNLLGLILSTARWFVLYSGSIRASVVLYKRLLERVLFAQIRFHDTVSRGRLLNRFGKDFEGIDSSLAENFGRSATNGLSALTTLITVSIVGGWRFLIAAMFLVMLYYNAAKVYGQTSRDMRRLDSVTRSPLYSLYGETISGTTVVRAFGASSKFLRDMMRCVDTNTNPWWWTWGVNRWLSVRFNTLSTGVVASMALVAVLNPGINASLAGFALAFANAISGDLLFMVRRFVSLEQSMVAVERVKEYSEIPKEGAEFVEPRPPKSWPSMGAISCSSLVIRYAPDLPDVLHNLSFDILPGEKVGILGRTGSGKSTLALSFFRFVEATEGCIAVDGIDISTVGLSDLRSKLTIIPQDPTILSGTLRSTLDVFDEYQDAEIFEALRRVHLLTEADDTEDEANMFNVNAFRDLDAPVSADGENFSSGEKQLLCMARAILKRSKLLVMDEATASVDYATDELISKTIRHEFSDSTILTIAHRLRTVIDYDRIMLLEQGSIVEFDSPKTLLQNPESKFYLLCKAAGKEEFATLKRMAGV
ncbi:multidrug resistance-associated ABC transporter [Mycena floridula]|nr:multidrug resistance-associated ABC transporter [Mycena floridula]